MRFSGKNIIITGGGQGVGKALALRMAQEGGNVAIVDVNEETGNQTCELIREYGVKAKCYPCDLSNPQQTEEVFQTIIDEVGKIDILVNNAGIISRVPFEDLSYEEFTRVININLTSYFVTSQIIFRHMKGNGGGRIVNMGSVAAKRGGGFIGTAAYATSKNGVVGLSKAIAREGAPYNIACNVVSPSWIRTDMTAGITPEKEKLMEAGIPMGRAARIEEVVALICFYASDEASFITGEVGCVDGGYSMDG